MLLFDSFLKEEYFLGHPVFIQNSAFYYKNLQHKKQCKNY